jgi:DNA-binding SARP family transcriptional activator
VLRREDGAYQLNPKGVFDSDFDAFNRAMLQADAAREEEIRESRLSEAVAAYKGQLLSATYSDWVEPLRREEEDRYIEALNELGARKVRDGSHEEALTIFRSLEAVDAYSEAAAVGIMRAHLAMNDGPAAARHYRRFKQVLKDELDEEPSERLAELYRQATAQG